MSFLLITISKFAPIVAISYIKDNPWFKPGNIGFGLILGTPFVIGYFGVTEISVTLHGTWLSKKHEALIRSNFNQKNCKLLYNLILILLPFESNWVVSWRKSSNEEKTRNAPRLYHSYFQCKRCHLKQNIIKVNRTEIGFCEEHRAS